MPRLEDAYGYYVTFHMLTKAQIDLGNEVEVFYPARDTSTRGATSQTRPASSRPFWRMPFGAELTKLLDDFDVIHAHARSGLVYAQLRRRGPPLVVHLHGLPYRITDPRSAPKGSWLGTAYDLRSYLDYKTMLGQADLVITYCRGLAKRVIELFSLDPGRVCVVDNGVEPRFFEGNEDAREELGLVDEPLLIYVGRFSDIKGVDELLQSIPRLKDRVPDLRILFVGCSAEELREVIGQIPDDFIVLPHVPYNKVACYYRASDAHVAITRVYGYQKTVLEALASKCPVVASDNPDNRSVIGNAGTFVDPRKPEEIASGIQQALSGEYAEATARASKRILTDFSWGRAARRIQNIYHRIT